MTETLKEKYCPVILSRNPLSCHLGAPTSSFSLGTEAAAERFQALGHYRIYQLDPSDHITAGFSVGVEVWKSFNRVAHLSTGRPWPARFTEPMVGLGGNGSSQ
jgi:hypothetical protein